MGKNKKDEEVPVLTDIKRTERVSLRKRRTPKGLDAVKENLDENKRALLLFLVIVASLAVIIVSIFSLQLPAVPVCVIVVIEAALAVCLHEVPLWLHGLVVIGQLAVGGFCGNLTFILMGVALYILCIIVLRYIRD
jgi:hypothetical protein